MTLVHADPWLSVYAGDVRAVLPSLPDDSVDCVVTSPPYWKQRSYLPASDERKALEIGQEATFDEWAATIIGICRELARALKPQGSLWLVLGDRYTAYSGPTGSRRHDWYVPRNKGGRDRTHSLSGFPVGVRRKSLVLAPYRVAIALEEEGWILRDRIVWWKRNGVPESTQDRFHVRDEVLFRFTLQQRAYFDVAAIREPYAVSTRQRHQPHRAMTFTGRGNAPPGQAPRTPRKAPWTGRGDADAHRDAFHRERGIRSDGKNPGNVWPIATASRPGNRYDHFAMFPGELVRRPILATCPPGGVVLDPFAGTGTTGEVANELLRRAILIELDPASLEAIETRCSRRPVVAVPA